MKEPTLGNPQNTIAVLQKYNFSFQKKFGQNFLIDTHVLDKIIASAEITKDDMVLEIGPGIGTMTQYLACAARKVVAENLRQRAHKEAKLKAEAEEIAASLPEKKQKGEKPGLPM